MNPRSPIPDAGHESFIHSPHPYLASALAAVFAAMTVWGAYGSYLCDRDGRESRDWPVAEGKIESLEIAERNNHGKKEWWVWIEYAYPVEGKTYRSKRWQIGFDSNVFPQGGPGNPAEKYKVGAPCGVHYRPQDPRNSVLKPGIEPGTVPYQVVVAAIAALAGTIALFKAIADFRWLSERRRSAELFEEFKAGRGNAGGA